jgi:DNA-binding response OmpR family regulator
VPLTGCVKFAPFFIPSTQFALQEKANMKASIHSTFPSLTKQIILVIEDDLQMKNLLVLLLERSGLDVMASELGEEGLRLAQNHPVDLILSDIDLPDISGFEVCRRLKENPELRSIPVIIMSGRLTEGNAAQAMDLGAADYITKPCPAKEILAKVAAHLAARLNRSAP